MQSAGHATHKGDTTEVLSVSSMLGYELLDKVTVPKSARRMY